MLESRFEEIIGTDGKIFSVVFKKKNSELRKMICRKGVSRYLIGSTGKGKTPVKGLINVWDTQVSTGKSAYRSFYADSIVSLKAHGKVYNSEGEEVA